MSAPVDLAKVKWLALCEQAERAVTLRHNGAAEDLPLQAGRLTTVKPVPFVAADEALLNSFRWDCTAYGLAQPITRRLLAPGLLAKAQLVRLLISPPEPTPGAAALAVPEDAADAPLPAWTARADCGTGG